MGKSSATEAYVYNRENNNLIFGTNNAERMRIDSSGNVGIGTTSMSAKLDVRGTTPFSASTTYGSFTFRDISTTGQELHIRPNAGKSAYITFTENAVSDNWAIGTDAGNSALLFKTGNASGTERMRIDSSGALLVGTTTADGRISAETTGNVITSKQNGAGGWCYKSNAANNSGTRYQIEFLSDGNAAGSITSGASTTTYGTTSDYRLKENVAPMTGALAKVQALKPVTYTWVRDGADGQGFIAHELQNVVPDCVVGKKDAVDTEGNPVYQVVDTSFLVATLTAAIQEQQAMIETLTTRLNALEGK
jgi:hypothetical protein